MDVKKWHFWLLTVITIILLVVVVYVYEKVSDCCESGAGPGPGPIIVVQPTGGGSTPTASWTVGGATAPFGTTGQLREDAFGSVEQFKAKSSDAVCAGTCQVQKLEISILKGGSGSEIHTITIEKTTSNQIAWSVDGNPLVACDFKSSNAVPDCSTGTSGLPLEFDGTIQSVTVTPSYSGGPVVTFSAFDYVTIQAKS